MITTQQISALAHQAQPWIMDAIVDHAPAVFPVRGINTARRLQYAMTFMCVESDYFTQVEENLSYSAIRLTQVWPSRFPNIQSALPYAHNPRALGNKVYGGRMGNVGVDDGFENRGQGLIQTTGLSNMQRLASKMNAPVNEVREMLVAKETMLDCALATLDMLNFWQAADADDLELAIKHVRGGCSHQDMLTRGAVLHKAKTIFTHI